MHAAVVRSFDSPPRYEDYDLPAVTDGDRVVVEVLAAGLHPRVRSQANGSHYTSTDELPLVPGIDGVGRMQDGSLVYFLLPDTTLGSMAQQTIIDRNRCVTLPEGTDVDLVAAAMNPAMSSWIALTRRISLQPGQSVLVLGATGSAGRLAVQIAKHLGAGQVIAAGRDQARLEAVDADVKLSLNGDGAALGEVAADVDVVIDYVWGEPAAQAMVALVKARADASKGLDWIQIGSMAGPSLNLPSAALRAANLRILGSGQGSVRTRDILAELPRLASEISSGSFAMDVRTVPLADVERTWPSPTVAERVVLKP